ncbi:MAG: hypothetical protein Q8P52_01620 [bacterium]|nr:hypothetical protein [bacterium]
MRLFLFNPDQPFSLSDIANRAKVKTAAVKKELSVLKNAHMIHVKRFMRILETVKLGKPKVTKKWEGGWVLNQSFPYMSQLQNLLIYTVFVKPDELVRRLSVAGKVKLVIIAGVFIQDTDSRIDILVVADHLKDGQLSNAIKNLEAEIGKELKYAAFETPDFQYRLGMYDKLVRDVLDYPHTTIYDKIGVYERKV